jgi:glycoside/pentoside/hexuronide:cation symporter, GPH family
MSSPSPAATGRLKLATILAFSGPSLPFAGLATVYGVYLTPYYTGSLGLAFGAVAGAFLVIRAIDLFFDPLLGWVMDKTRTPIGRFRPWTIAGTPVMLLAVYMLFMAPKGITMGYLIGWALLFAAGSSMVILSGAAWAANIATNYNDRSRVYGVMQGVGGIGAMLMLLMMVIFAKPHPGWPNAIHVAAWSVLVLTPLLTLVMVTTVKEPVAPSNLHQRFALSDYWEMISRPEMRRLIFADLALALGPGTTAPLYLFFFHDVLKFTGAESGILLMFYTGASFFGAPIIGLVATRFNKHRTLIGATVGYAICQASLFIIPRGNFVAALPGMIGCGFLAAGFLLLVRAMIADVGDEVRLEQGKERMSLLYSLVTTTTKIGGAITVPITYGVLQAVGYKATPGAINTPAAIHGLEMCYLFAPVIFVLAGGLVMFGYKLDGKRHAEIRAKLELRDAAIGAGEVVAAMGGEIAPAPAPAE